jgi:hypothetical protein
MEGTKKRLIISSVLTNMFRSVLALSPGVAKPQLQPWRQKHCDVRAALHRKRPVRFLPMCGSTVNLTPASTWAAEDVLATCYLTCGKIAPDFEQLELSVGESTVAAAVVETTGTLQLSSSCACRHELLSNSKKRNVVLGSAAEPQYRVWRHGPLSIGLHNLVQARQATNGFVLFWQACLGRGCGTCTSGWGIWATSRRPAGANRYGILHMCCIIRA